MAAYSPLAAAAGSPRGIGANANIFGLPGSGTGQQGADLINPALPHGALATNTNGPTGRGQNGGQTPVVPLPITQATTPGAAGAPTPTAGQFSFNLQTDPALQQVNALVGMSDQQAQAQALKERQQLLLQYGDPNLAAAVLGQGDPTAQAAAQNPESQLAMLDRQNAQNLKGFEQQLDPSLAFSGYKIGQEQQLGQNYQDALARAAGGAQSGLDQINGNLNSALEQNAMQEQGGLQQAFMDMLAQILAGGTPIPSGTTAGQGAITPDMVAPPTPMTTAAFGPTAQQVRNAPVPGGKFYRTAT